MSHNVKPVKFRTTGNPKIKVGSMVQESNLEGTRGDKKSPHHKYYPTKGTEVGMVAKKNRTILKQT